MVYTGLGGVVEHLNVEQRNRSKNKTTNRSVTEDERHGIDLQVSRVNCRLSCSKTNAVLTPTTTVGAIQLLDVVVIIVITATHWIPFVGRSAIGHAIVELI